MFLIEARQESGHVNKGDNRDIEGIAGADETGGFVGRIDVQAAPHKTGIVGHHADHHAVEAAKAGAEAGINFVLQAPLILKKGVAENLRPKDGARTIREFIDEALDAGVNFYVCDTALDLCSMTPEDLIEEVEDLVGPSFLIKEGLKADLVLSF